MHDAWRVRRGGRLVWADTLRLDGDMGAVVDHPATLDCAVAVATVCYVADGAAALIDTARAALVDTGCRSGATSVDPGILLVRLFGRDAAAVRTQLAALWSALRAAAFGHPPRPPRLWNV